MTHSDEDPYSIDWVIARVRNGEWTRLRRIWRTHPDRKVIQRALMTYLTSIPERDACLVVERAGPMLGESPRTMSKA